MRDSKNNTFRVIPMTDRVYETLQNQRQKGIIPYVLPGTKGPSATEPDRTRQVEAVVVTLTGEFEYATANGVAQRRLLPLAWPPE